MSDLALAALLWTLSACALSLTGVAVFVGLRWHRRLQEQHDDHFELPAKMVARMADPTLENVVDFVRDSKSMDGLALDAWIKERMEEDDWSEDDVRGWLDSRETIELT